MTRSKKENSNTSAMAKLAVASFGSAMTTVMGGNIQGAVVDLTANLPTGSHAFGANVSGNRPNYGQNSGGDNGVLNFDFIGPGGSTDGIADLQVWNTGFGGGRHIYHTRGYYGQPYGPKASGDWPTGNTAGYLNGLRVSTQGGSLTAGATFSPSPTKNGIRGGQYPPPWNGLNSKNVSGTRYFGFRTKGNQLGWISINYTGPTPAPWTAVAAAYESSPNTAISVGPSVPEPSTMVGMGALATLALGAVGAARLRKKNS